MKDYLLGIIKHKCSQAMRKGKFVRVHNFLFRKKCPNCRALVKVKKVIE